MANLWPDQVIRPDPVNTRTGIGALGGESMTDGMIGKLKEHLSQPTSLFNNSF